MTFSKKGRFLDFKTVALVLFVKALLLVFAIQSFQIVNDQPIDESVGFLGIWKHWDATNYLKIAEFGYTGVGEDRFLLVFFPLYPAFVALTEAVVGDFIASAFIVSGIASIFLGLVFRKLVLLDYSEKTARYAVLFLFIFPTSYFLHIPYTESLFLALCVGSFLSARKRLWILAGILGGLACLTRINGLFLLPALCFEVLEDYREKRRLDTKWLGLFLIPAGFGIYLSINYYLTNNPFAFLDFQQEHWGKYIRFPFYGLYDAYKVIFWKKPSPALMEGFQELLFVCIGLISIVLGWKKLRNSYRFWMIANWLLFISTSFILSIPRYTLTLFPIFILMAIAARTNWLAKALFIIWSGLFLSLFVTQYVRGWWAF